MTPSPAGVDFFSCSSGKSGKKKKSMKPLLRALLILGQPLPEEYFLGKLPSAVTHPPPSGGALLWSKSLSGELN